MSLVVAGISAGSQPAALTLAGIAAATPPNRLFIAGIATAPPVDTTVVTLQRKNIGAVLLHRKNIGQVTVHRKGIPMPFGVSGQWTLDFEDTFTTLNTAIWTPLRGIDDGTFNTPFNPDIESAAFDPAQVSIENSKLILSAAPVPLLGTDGVTYPYRAGTINSEKGYSFLYGFTEARMAVPVDRAWWPGWWLMASGHWPPEIDMAEFLPTGDAAKVSVTANLHWADGFGVHQQQGSKTYGAELFEHDWHVYGLLWAADRVQFFFDGHPGPLFTSVIPHEAMYFIFNMSLHQGYDPGSTRMLVDYVRVWKPI